MAHLQRLQVGMFDIENASTLSEVEEAVSGGFLEKLLIPVDRLFMQYPAVVVNMEAQKKLRSGNGLSAKEFTEISAGEQTDAVRAAGEPAGVQGADEHAVHVQAEDEQTAQRQAAEKKVPKMRPALVRVYDPDEGFAALYGWSADKGLYVPSKMFL